MKFDEMSYSDGELLAYYIGMEERRNEVYLLVALLGTLVITIILAYMFVYNSEISTLFDVTASNDRLILHRMREIIISAQMLLIGILPLSLRGLISLFSLI